MINFNNSNELFIGDILKYVDQAEVYSRFLNFIPEENTFYSSPFSKDKNPSFRFQWYNGKLLYKCFSTNQTGNCINLVAYLEKCSNLNAIQIIANRLNIKNEIRQHETFNFAKKETKIEVIVHQFYPMSFYVYWNKFGVTKEILDLYDIKPAKQVWLNDFIAAQYKDSSPVIRYRVNGRYKIYKPYETLYKWLSNTKQHDIFGLTQLPKTGDLLIISKAMKDICCWKALGYWSIATCSEVVLIPLNIMEDLKLRFKKIIVILDNDEAGITTMNKYIQTYSLACYCVPLSLGYKDIAEVRENTSEKYLKKIIHNLTKLPCQD
jgi:DNA primase